MRILVDGAGTVGTNVLRALSSSDIDTIATKHSIKKDTRTANLAQLMQDCGPVPLYLAHESNNQHMPDKSNGLEVTGSRKDLAYDDITAVVCCLDNATTKDYVPAYHENSKPFLLQGGADDTIVKQDFLSAPNTIGHARFSELAGRNARHVSCNTTYAATALGLLLDLYTPQDIESVDVFLRRRCRDPGEAKKMLTEPTAAKHGTHHAHDIESVLPQLAGKVTSRANKNPWEHYHRAEITVTLKRQVRDADLDQIRDAFRRYQRAIYVPEDIGAATKEDMERMRRESDLLLRGFWTEADAYDANVASAQRGIQTLRAACEKMGITDGDCLLPTYSVHRNGAYTLRITGYNPQRSIVTLSNMDWIFGLEDPESWAYAFDQTNRQVRWHGLTLKELKSGLEWRLAEACHAKH